MLFRTPALSLRDSGVIETIDKAHQDLAHVLHGARRWTGLLRRSTLGRVIRGSNTIEGYVIPKEDLVAAAAGETVAGDPTTKLATETYRRAMTHVLGLAHDPHFEWTAAVLKALHYMMMEYDMEKSPGRWRTGPIFVVDEEKGETVYEGPEFSLVPALMNEFVESLSTPSSETPAIVRAAMAHLNLVMIHPFKDGNGRMARCVQTLVLGRAGTLEPLFSSIEEFLGANTRPYYDVLAVVGTGRWQPQSDAQPWVRFCLRAHYYQVQTFLRRTRESERLMSLLEQAVLDKGLPERTRLALWDAAQGFRVRNSTYRTAADVEQQTASRDLTALVRAGLLLSEGEKKGRAYLASALLADLRRQAQESRLITDPYKEATVLTPPMASTTGGDTTTALISGFPESPSATGSRPPSRRLPGER